MVDGYAKLTPMIPLSAVLSERGLSLTAVHLPRPDAQLRWVATSELVDPTPFLEGGELLLTTGLATTGWRSQWIAYVAGLRDVGVAGLGIGTGLTHRKPPRGLIRACEELGVNLVEVPRPTAFVAVSRRAADLLEQEQERTARIVLALQRRLTVAAAGPEPSAAILQELAKSLTGATCLLAPTGQVVAGSPGDLDLSEIRDRIRAIRSQGMHAAVTLSEPGYVTILQPIGLKQRPESYLVTGTTGRPTEAQGRAVSTAAVLLALVSEQQRDKRESRRRVAARAFDLLVSGDLRTAQLLLERDVSFPPKLKVLAARGPADAIDDALAIVEKAIPLAALVNGELFVVSPAAGAERIAVELAGLGLYVGVGDTAKPDNLGPGRTTATQALAQTSAAKPIVQWARVVREGVAALVDDKLAAAFAASYLGLLTDEQLETLQSFLRHHGSRLKVAAELSLHRNTVRNRLHQIEHQLGVTLNDPQVRMTAWFALQSR